MPGGYDVMLFGVAAAALLSWCVVLVLRKFLPPFTAWSWGFLLGSVLAIAVLTLTPSYSVPDIIPLDEAQQQCSFDYGGPAPEGFWLLGGSQRMLNVAAFVPAGFFLVLALGRWRSAWVLAPLGLLGLVAYSVAIEFSQLALSRIDRACDVTDMVDNAVGAGIGFVAGLLVLVIARPWRHRSPRR